MRTWQNPRWPVKLGLHFWEMLLFVGTAAPAGLNLIVPSAFEGLHPSLLTAALRGLEPIISAGKHRPGLACVFQSYRYSWALSPLRGFGLICYRLQVLAHLATCFRPSGAVARRNVGGTSIKCRW